MTKRTNRPIHAMYLLDGTYIMPGDNICLNCPLPPETCEISHAHPADAKRCKTAPKCLRDFTLWSRVSLQTGDKLAGQVLDPNDSRTANWFRRAVEVTAQRERVYQELKPKMKQTKAVA